MVKKLFRLFQSEIHGLHQAAYLLAFFAFLSQVLGLVRDRLFASSFGANEILDVYYAAFRIPDILFVIIGSVVSLSVIIPFLVNALEEGETEARIFIDSVFSLFSLCALVLGVVVYIATPFLLSLLFPFFMQGPYMTDLVFLSRVLILSPIFLSLSNLLASITQIKKRFLVYAFSPIFYNIGIIVGIIFFYPSFGLIGLGFGVVLGAFLHMAIQIPFIIQTGLLPQVRMRPRVAVFKKIIQTSLPRTLTVSSAELAELFLISFASFFTVGSIAVFNFSFNLQSVPFSIIGVSYALAAFPTLSKLFSKGERDQFLAELLHSSRHIIFWSIHISVVFIVLRAQIVRILLGAGRFNWDDTRLTAAALALFTISLLAQNLTTLFTRAYYARGQTKKPFIIHAVSAVVIVVSSMMLVSVFQTSMFFRDFFESLFKVIGVPGTVILMLPLGYSVGLFVNLLWYMFDFHTHFPEYGKGIYKSCKDSFLSAIIMGFVMYKALYLTEILFETNTFLGILSQTVFSGLAGLVVGVVVLFLLGSVELQEVYKTLHKKIWKSKVSMPDATLE